MIVIFCDGACAGNQFSQNVGGWGAVIQKGSGDRLEISGSKRNTTNQRMELMACIEALKVVKGQNMPVGVYSDSAYLVNCINQKWYERWLRNGWINSRGLPVENQDLWRALLELLDGMDVVFRKVKGHAGVGLNDRADELAQKAIREAGV